MKDLLLAVPSRGRPESISRLIDAMDKNCRGDTTLVVGLDDDDPTLSRYPTGPEYEVRSGMRQVVAWINELTVPRTDEYRFIGHIGDDNVPRTEGWDIKIMEALGKTPFAFGNDLNARDPGSLCCHIFCRSEIIKGLGYLGVPVFKHMFIDPVWMEWGKATGISYLHDVIIEHMHFTMNKSYHDNTYAEAYDKWNEDEAAFHMYCSDPNGLQRDIQKIQDIVGNGN